MTVHFQKMKDYQRLIRYRESRHFPFTTALEWYKEEQARQTQARKVLKRLPQELEQEIMQLTYLFVIRSLFQ